jgi:hypothetical protein
VGFEVSGVTFDQLRDGLNEYHDHYIALYSTMLIYDDEYKPTAMRQYAQMFSRFFATPPAFMDPANDAKLLRLFDYFVLFYDSVVTFEK